MCSSRAGEPLSTTQLADGFRERPSMVVLAVIDDTRVGLVRMLRTIREARRSDARVHLSRIRQPALVVRGSRDPLVSAGWAEELAATLPAGSLVTLHGAPYSAVEPFVAAVRAFLATVERRAPGA